MSDSMNEEKQVKKREPRSNQKLKIMYLAKILLENTDETHDITLQEIIEKLDGYNVTAERKSLYDDIEQLRHYGINVVGTQRNRTYYYKVVNRQFELAELKLLVDSVQSSKFITTKKSNDLIKKIEGLASRYEASQLQRHVYVSNRVKSMNEDILRNVDAIHNAINTNSKIQFQYYEWTVAKKLEPRKDGKIYDISPWAMSWDDENYYLIAYDSEAMKVKHYRVDKMKNINVTGEKRDGKEFFKSFDMAEYAKKTFGMFDGEEEMVKLFCTNDMAGVMIDRFGKEVRMLPKDEEHFTVTVKVSVSKHFLGWVMALGEGVKIIEPEVVVEKVNSEIDRLIRQYRQ